MQEPNPELLSPLTEEHYWHSQTSIKALKYSFSDSIDQGPAYQTCLKYAENIGEMLENDIGIRLHGEVGTGKTFYASCIGSYAVRRGYPVAWIDTKSFITEMADYRTRNENYIEKIMAARILIMDDLDTRKLNSLELACLFRFINAREDGLNIITTNMTPQNITKNEASDMDEKRALSRIQALCPVALVLTGTDRRKDVAAEKRALAAKIMDGGADK